MPRYVEIDDAVILIDDIVRVSKDINYEGKIVCEVHYKDGQTHTLKGPSAADLFKKLARALTGIEDEDES